MSTHTFLTNLDFRLNWTFLFVSCTITVGNFEIMICLMFFSKKLVEDFRLKEGYSVLNISVTLLMLLGSFPLIKNTIARF